MTRFDMLVVMGLGLVILLAITLRWLGRQRWRSATLGRRACVLVASQEVRFAIEEVAPGAARFEEGRLTGFNNRRETRFEDVKSVLRLAGQRVRGRLQ